MGLPSKSTKGTEFPLRIGTLLRTVAIAATICVAASVRAQPTKGQPVTNNAKLPTILRVVSADKTQVALAWQPSDESLKKFHVERKELGGGEYKIIAKIDGTADPKSHNAYVDREIQPYTPYAYRVVPIEPTNTAAPSNEVAAGPPLTGYHAIASDSSDPKFGQQLAMCLDENDDPALAFIATQRNEAKELVNQELKFIRWSRAQFKWLPAVTIDTLQPTSYSVKQIEISLAYEPISNVFGLVYRSGDTVWLARSREVGVWKREPISVDSSDKGRCPRIAYVGSNELIVFGSVQRGIRFLSRASDAATFDEKPIPAPAGMKWDPALALTLTVGSNQSCLVGFWCQSSNRRKFVVADPNAGKEEPQIPIGTSKTSAFCELSFDEKRLWGVGFCPGNEGDALLQVIERVSEDKWNSTSLVEFAVPPIRGPFAIATGPRGERALLLGREADPSIGPAILRYRSDGTWGPVKQPDADRKLEEIRSPVLRFCPNGLLYAAFQNGDLNSNLSTGIILWREAPR